MLQKIKTTNGFTLTELIVVIVILLIVSIIVIQGVYVSKQFCENVNGVQIITQEREQTEKQY